MVDSLSEPALLPLGFIDARSCRKVHSNRVTEVPVLGSARRPIRKLSRLRMVKFTQRLGGPDVPRPVGGQPKLEGSACIFSVGLNNRGVEFGVQIFLGPVRIVVVLGVWGTFRRHSLAQSGDFNH